MTSILNDISSRFSNSAATYDQAATIQLQLARQLARMTAPHIPHNAHILDIGCGTGTLSALLAPLVNPSHLTLLDISDTMLAQAQLKLHSLPHTQLSLLNANAETIPYPKADAIISSSAVQWFNNPLDLPAKAHASLPHNAILALATYGPDTFSELRDGQPAPYPTLNQWLDALTHAHFSIIDTYHHTLTQHFPSHIQMLRMIALSGIGAHPHNSPHTLTQHGPCSLTWESLAIVATHN